MDSGLWTAVIAVAGIAGTAGSPLLAERMRRKSARDEQLRTVRLALYGDVLRLVGRVVQNANTWASIPTAALAEPDPDELDRLMAQTEVVCGTEVLVALTHLKRTFFEFLPGLDLARREEGRAQASGHADSAEAITARMRLGTVAGRLSEQYAELQKQIRADVP